ncbi:MAG: hypothetical protein IKZ11_03545 [Alistipes sp.]|nr:hypothetical protein [Alistipes sp.]
MNLDRKPLISVIVCSIKPDEAELLAQNVAQTVGLEHEMIVRDNRTDGKGICRVYNECAELAQGEYLCFVHEDVAFCTPEWGKKIVAKLSETDCGVIGFAGSTVKYGLRYGWQGIRRYTRKNYIASTPTKPGSLRTSADGQDFAEVICLDGMCLCVRRDVWERVRFDEESFSGFHSYDTDFTTAVCHAGYKNYVSYSVLVEHRSLGSFSRAWYKSVEAYNKKWAKRLPLYVAEHSPSEVEANATATEAFGLKLLIKNKILSREEARAEVFGFWRRNRFKLGSYGLIFKYLNTKYEK